VQNKVWREIRALRAAPTGRAAGHNKRGATFKAALRQAEELAAAAAAVGYASSPLPLFYAVEQAGLAIAAAKHKDDSPPSSHGLSFDGDFRDKNILRRQVKPDSERGTFPMVCDALRSPQLAGPVELGALWAANPDLHAVPIPPSYGTWHRSIDQVVGVRQLYDGHGLVKQDAEAAVVNTGGYMPISVPVPGDTVAEVEEAVQVYPTLRDTHGLVQGPYGAVRGKPDDKMRRHPHLYRDRFSERVEVGLPIPLQISHAELWGQQDRLFSVLEVEPSYPLHPDPHMIGFVLPELAGGNAPHPLMLWWALLFGLSNLVRYHPAPWVAALDLDRSEVAVRLEQVLDIAAERVPERLLAALRDPVGHA
jgi:hypothetical protein